VADMALRNETFIPDVYAPVQGSPAMDLHPQWASRGEAEGMMGPPTPMTATQEQAHKRREVAVIADHHTFSRGAKAEEHAP
jgi:hypothetical protein